MGRRDHYKGIPKTKNAVVRSDGRVEALDKIRRATALRQSVDYLIVERQDPVERRVIYARSGGNDVNGDGTLTAPYRTFRRCLDELPTAANGTIWYIDITGIGVETLTEMVSIPPFSSNMPMRLTLSSPLDSIRHIHEGALNIFAEPTVLETFTPTSTSANATTGMVSFTDSAQSWTNDEHRGKLILGQALFSSAVIYGNDATTLFTTAGSVFSGELSIAEQSATLMYGTGTPVGTDYGFLMNGITCNVVVIGIKFDSPSTQVTSMNGCTSQNYFQLCDFTSGFVCQNGGDFIFDANIMRGGFSQNGCAVTMRSALFDSVSFTSHGDGGAGLDFWYETRFEGTTTLGHGGNAESEISYHYESLSIDDSPAAAINFRGGPRVRITNCDISNCGGNAISALGPGFVAVNGVTGSGNTGYGIYATDGVQVSATSSVTVSGTSGSIKVGSKAEESWASFRAGTKNSIDIVGDDATLARLWDPA